TEVAYAPLPRLPERATLSWREADAGSPEAVARLMSEYDLAVGALPSRFGFGVMQAAIEAKKNLVDVSFCPEDAMDLDRAARKAGVAIVPDCGLAPGLSHLVVGRAVAEHGTPQEITIY